MYPIYPIYPMYPMYPIYVYPVQCYVSYVGTASSHCLGSGRSCVQLSECMLSLLARGMCLIDLTKVGLKYAIGHNMD